MRRPPRPTRTDTPFPYTTLFRARPVSLTRLEAFRLENGLQVIAIPFPDTETVTIMVWYKAGSADDPPDKPGVAHFVEHATFAAMGDHNEDERRTTRGARDRKSTRLNSSH